MADQNPTWISCYHCYRHFMFHIFLVYLFDECPPCRALLYMRGSQYQTLASRFLNVIDSYYRQNYYFVHGCSASVFDSCLGITTYEMISLGLTRVFCLSCKQPAGWKIVRNTIPSIFCFMCWQALNLTCSSGRNTIQIRRDMFDVVCNV